MAQNDTGISAYGAPDEEVVSSLQTTDWNEEWKALQRARRAADDAQYWNSRAKTFTTSDAPHSYSSQFLRLAQVTPGQTVLDMGCGTGTLAVPLALQGCRVIAADFSSAMLEQLQARIEATGAQGVEAKLLAWADDWEQAGLNERSVDVAIASRSISTDDMGAALDKLTRIARKRCCISLPTGCSPRTDPRVLELVGVRNTHGADHQYAWNILQNRGLYPTCCYIPSMRKDTFNSLDEACADMGRMIDEALGQADDAEMSRAKDKLRAWLAQELVANEEAGEPDSKGRAQRKLRLREPRVVTWAFISWEPPQG